MNITIITAIIIVITTAIIVVIIINANRKVPGERLERTALWNRPGSRQPSVLAGAPHIWSLV